MLDNLRKSAHGIFGKILLGILVLSFGIWGIGDIFRNGGGIPKVATVGSSFISAQEYNRALRNRMEALQQRLGKGYSPELMKKLGLGMIVLDELINNMLLNNEAAELGIVIGDDDIIKEISRNPAFQDKDGKFDKDNYLGILKARGLSEQSYVADLRKYMAAQLLADTMTSGITVPDGFVKAVYKAREEQRSGTILLIPASAMKNIPLPGEQEIKSYYDSHGKSFLTPEYRSVSYVELKTGSSEIQSGIDVTEDEIQHYYEEKIQDFHKSEQRDVQQMIFEKQADADKAYDQIVHGKHFADLAKTANINNKGKTSLGLITKENIASDEAEAIFSLKEGSITKPLKSAFGWHIFYVNKIMPESNLPLERVRNDIIKDLRSGKETDIISHLATQMEDSMAGGMSLEDAAKKIGRKVEKLGKLTRDGKSPTNSNLIETAFSLGEKDHSQAIQSSDGSYLIVRVDSITPEHAIPLAEVKERIITALKEEKTRTLLKSTANDVAAELSAGKKPALQLASIPSGNLKQVSEVSGNGKTKLPPALVKEMFGIAKNKHTHAYLAENGDYMIASLNNIIPAPANPDAKTLQSITSELKATMSNQVITDYITYLRTKHHVSVNEALTSAKDESEE